jgi:hypothetical protein
MTVSKVPKLADLSAEEHKAAQEHLSQCRCDTNQNKEGPPRCH